jgi:hypothetical protein
MTRVTGQAGPSRSARARSWRAARARSGLAVAALAAGAVAWATLPAGGAAPGLRPVLAAAVLCALFTAARLVAVPGAAARRQPASYEGALTGFVRRVWGSSLVLPWPQGLTVAVLGLEALHPSRPWHTVVLGVVLLAFLLALHLAETAARPSVFRPHLPFLAAGLGLAALSAGAAMLPGLGADAGWLAVLAAIAAVIAAALSLPL